MSEQLDTGAPTDKVILLAERSILIKQRDELRGKLADCALSDAIHCQEIIEQGEEIITLRQQRDAAVAALRAALDCLTLGSLELAVKYGDGYDPTDVVEAAKTALVLCQEQQP